MVSLKISETVGCGKTTSSISLSVIQFLNRAETLSQDFSMAAVRPEDEIIDRKCISHTNGGSLLTDRKVSRTRVIVGNTAVLAGSFDQVQHGFKFANHHHVVVDTDQIIVRKILFFLLNGLVVLVNRDGFESDFPGLSGDTWVNKLDFRHIKKMKNEK